MVHSDDCGKCNIVVTNRQHALLCDNCDVWFHRKCMRGTISYMTQDVYLANVNGETPFDWICDRCDSSQTNTVSITHL